MTEAQAVQAVVVTGDPGCGKSTVGRLLARRLHAALLDLDTATAALTGAIGTLVGTDDLDDPRLVDATRAARYETLVALAEENVGIGLSVVVVAPFTSERRDASAWEQVRLRLLRAGGQPSLVWLSLAPDQVVERLRGRGATRDARRLELRGIHAAPALRPPTSRHIAVDAAQSPEAVAAAVLLALPA